MDNSSILVGVFLIAVFVLSALWHLRENTKLEQELQKKLDPQAAQWLLRFAWSRTLQLLAALGLCIVIFINFDRELSDSRNSLDTLTEAIEKKDKSDRALAAQQKKIQLAQELANKQKIAQLPPATVVKPAPQPQAPAANTTVIQPTAVQPPVQANAIVAQEKTANETIEALYNPEKDQTDKQSGLDDLKKRYEDIIVIHLFLKRCNKIQANDFNVISYALSQEIASAEAPDNLQDNIMTAAQGSYNEIYAKSPCNGKNINELTTQYNNYIQILATNFPQG